MGHGVRALLSLTTVSKLALCSYADPLSMEPLTNSTAMLAAVEIWRNLTAYMHPAGLSTCTSVNKVDVTWGQYKIISLDVRPAETCRCLAAWPVVHPCNLSAAPHTQEFLRGECAFTLNHDFQILGHNRSDWLHPSLYGRLGVAPVPGSQRVSGAGLNAAHASFCPHLCAGSRAVHAPVLCKT